MRWEQQAHTGLDESAQWEDLSERSVVETYGCCSRWTANRAGSTSRESLRPGQGVVSRGASLPPAPRVATENMRFRVTAAAVAAARDGSMPGGATRAGAAAALSAALSGTLLH